MNRRNILAGGTALLAGEALAAAPPPDAVAQYERATGGHLGFHAANLRTGRTLSWRADDRFVMCSTFKASLAALVLARADRGEERLGEPIRFGPADIAGMWAPVAQAHLAQGALSVAEMCAGAVEYSDNTCANLLLARVGGPAAVTAFWRSLGDRVSRLDDSEPLLNRTPPGGVRNTTTPRAMAATVSRLVFGTTLSAASRGTLRGWLIASRTGAARLRAGLPPSWNTGDKTGNNGKDAAGDLAVTWTAAAAPIVIAAYTRGGAPTEAQFAAAFAGVGRAVALALGEDRASDPRLTPAG